jgi:diacylglycerol kinase (ATP)
VTRNIVAILNPCAGGLARGSQRQAIESALAQVGVQLRLTTSPGDAVRLAAEARDADVLVAVGGDGTVSEVLTGMDRGRQVLAVVPAGTGNCLAMDLALGSAPSGIEALRSGSARTIDLIEARWLRSDGTSGARWLGSTAGLGYVVDVARLAKRRFARLSGHAYAAASAFVVPTARTLTMCIDTGPERSVRMTGLLANNTRHIGNAPAFPAASLADGLLDVFCFERSWAGQCLHNLRMVTGWPIPGTPSAWRARRVRLRCDAPEVAMLDGELLDGVRELELSCHAAAATCLV